MTDRAQRADAMVYGLVAAVALIAGAVALWTGLGDHDDDPPAPAVEAPQPAPPVSDPSSTEDEDEDEAGGVEIVEHRTRGRVGPDWQPDLPAVPDLATEPPPEREPREEDPRFQALGAEMRILSRARDLLEDHPAEALGILEQHRRRHPAGTLREEREAFAIEALVTLEHVEEAERRYYDFLRDFPHSDFRNRLERLMQRPPHRVGARGR